MYPELTKSFQLLATIASKIPYHSSLTTELDVFNKRLRILGKEVDALKKFKNNNSIFKKVMEDVRSLNDKLGTLLEVMKEEGSDSNESSRVIEEVSNSVSMLPTLEDMKFSMSSSST